MARARQMSSGAEADLRRVRHAKGLRYRRHASSLTRPRHIAESLVPRFRVAVFGDGYFWHGCPEHACCPRSNADYWREKLETNRSRDTDTDRLLNALGWRIVRIWEREDASDAANRIAELVDENRKNETGKCR